MTTWHVSLGYDWDSNPSSPWQGYLQWGAVNANQTPTSDSAFTNMAVGDTVQFYIYNVSALSNPNSSVGDGTSPSLTAPSTNPFPNNNPNFVSVGSGDSGQKGTALFSSTDMTNLNGGTTVSMGNQHSMYFGGTFPCWMVAASGQTTPYSASVANEGSFFVTWQVNVSNNNTVSPKTINFGVDPEMIVTSGG